MLTSHAGFSYKLHRLSPGCRGYPGFQDNADSAGPQTSACHVQDARNEGRRDLLTSASTYTLKGIESPNVCSRSKALDNQWTYFHLDQRPWTFLLAQIPLEIFPGTDGPGSFPSDPYPWTFLQGPMAWKFPLGHFCSDQWPWMGSKNFFSDLAFSIRIKIWIVISWWLLVNSYLGSKFQFLDPNILNWIIYPARCVGCLPWFRVEFCCCWLIN